MFKNRNKITLTLQEDKPKDSSNYEQNALYNKGYFASSNTASHIKHRILRLHELNGGNAEATLNSILKEINLELDNETS